MIKQVIHYIEQHHLVHERDKLLLAVSGGVDSMVLLDLFYYLQGQLSLQLHVAHFNYQLRAVDSDEDEKMVALVCEKKKIPFHVAREDTKTYAAKNKLGIQEAARHLRYNWFAEIKSKHQLDHIVTAHHADDNLETVIYHLAKGTGIAGMRGMRPINAQQVVRPMLGCSKAQILDYASEHKVNWREDSSNSISTYDRNLIRHEILPVMAQINPSVIENFHRTHDRMLGMELMLEQQIKMISQRYMEQKGDAITWQTSWMNDRVYDQLVLFEILKPYGFNYLIVDQVWGALTRSMGQRFRSSSYQVNIDRGSLIITPLVEQELVTDLIIDRINEHYQNGNLTLKLKKVAHQNYSGLSSDQVMLDLDTLSFPLIWRSWQQGDTIQPLGMKGRKKISDILIDEKVPIVQKDKVSVLVSRGEIVWLCGFRLNHRFRITPDTKNVLQLKIISE
jgi:tRNA(Ile)-lysidine synthase